VGYDPVVLRGGMGAKSRSSALARLQPQPGSPPLLVVATGPYAGEGFDCPILDTLFLAPVRWKGRLVQYAGRILRPYPGKETAEVYDYHDAGHGRARRSTGRLRARIHQPRGSPTPGGWPRHQASVPLKRVRRAPVRVALRPELPGRT
jgi:superfamily II DNA or RNA helicase